MNRKEALKQADAILLELISSGDEAVFEAARGPDGMVDKTKLALAAMRAREKLADRIMAEEG